MTIPISSATAELLNTLRAETYKAIARCRTLNYGPTWSFVKIKDRRPALLRMLKRHHPSLYIETSMDIDDKYVLLLDKGEVGVFKPGDVECEAISVTWFMWHVTDGAESDEENQEIVKRYISLIQKL